MSGITDWYREWFDSPYYHTLYFERDGKEAAAFIHLLLSYLHPAPGTRMLDLASGRGRHARILAAEGFDVTGIDLAAGSIAYALRYEQPNLHFYRHDMRQTLYTNYFDYVFNIFTSFGYFATQREHTNTIRAVSLSLRTGGTFVLDYLNVRYAEDHLVSHSAREIDGIHFHLTRWVDEKYFYKKILIEDKTRPAPLEFTERVARFTLDDFRMMFAGQGLQIGQVFGDYQLGTYDDRNSPRLLMIAKKMEK